MPSLLGLLKNNDLALRPSVIIFKKASKLGHYPIHRAPLGLTRIVQKFFICLSSFLSEGLQGGGGGGGGPCFIVPFKNWLVFPCSRIFFPLVPCFSNLLVPSPPHLGEWASFLL